MIARAFFARCVATCIAMCGATFAADAGAAVYRCEADGRVVYRDAPCEVGRQRVVETPPAPDAAARAAATARARADRDALATAERERARDASDARASAARDERAQASLRRQRATCARLAVRAKRATEDAAAANVGDAAKARTRARRAAEDEAARCRSVH